MESTPLSKEQKQQLVKELTAVASKITNIPEQVFVVYLNEHERDNIGSGGILLSERA